MVRKSLLLSGCVCVLLAASIPGNAGNIGLTWDSAPGATGYRVYYGTSAGALSNSINVGNTTGTTVNSLTDCTRWYFGVSAYNGAGESGLSEVVDSLPRPSIDSATPDGAEQGDQFTLTISGRNFESGAELAIDTPHVILQNASTTCQGQCDCQFQAVATVLPGASGERAAQIGQYEITVTNPNNVSGSMSQAFEVRLDPSRQDLSKIVASTDGRIDGLDYPTILALLSADQSVCDCCEATSCPNFNYDLDIDGDGWIDGSDLAYVTNAFFARCWDSSDQNWSTAACADHASQNGSN